MSKFKRYPLEFSDELHKQIEDQLLSSVLKNKKEYIIKAIEEKLERDAMKEGLK